MGFLSDLVGSSSQKQPPKPRKNDIWGNNTPEETAGAVGLGGARLPDDQAPPEKVIPDVIVSRVKAKQSSDYKHVDVWAFVKNVSSVEVEITDVHCIKQRTRPGRFLKPGGSYEIEVYSGPTPTNDAEVTATMMYKTIVQGEYFEASYNIGYHCIKNEHGEYHIPKSLDLMKPVKEIM